MTPSPSATRTRGNAGPIALRVVAWCVGIAGGVVAATYVAAFLWIVATASGV